MAAFAVLIGSTPFTDGPTFRADYRFTGSSLSAFTQMGQATWIAESGEIIGTPTAEGGGWLLLDGKSFQDTQIYADVLCTGGCKAGFLMRAEPMPDGGMRGVLMSVAEGDLSTYLVTVDARGREIDRVALETPSEGSRGRSVLPIPPDIAAQLPANLLDRPAGEFVPGGFNQVEVLMHENTVSPKFNNGRLGRGNTQPLPEEEHNGFGQIGLYVGGSGEAHFRDFMYRDALVRRWGPDENGANWETVRLDPHYYAWTAAVADYDRDGTKDVVAGAYAYFGPDYDTQRIVYPPVSFNPTSEYPQPAMVNIAFDFTGDGWPDVLSMSGNAGNGIGNLYVNPQNQSRHWPHHITIRPVGNEETLFKDITGDGRPDLIHAGDNRLRYSTFDPAQWDPENPTAMWTTHDVSEPGPWGVNIGHGLGVGDINGDGRSDYLNAYGWWEQPPAGSSGTWMHHPTAFGRWGATQGGAGGAEICTFDINGDGLLDAYGPMEGHGFGLAWWEQKRDANGVISFDEHIIMDNFLTENAGDVTFTEPHAAACGDVDGDSLPDLITGKRYMSHFGYSDPDPWGEPVIYAYLMRRNPDAPGGAEFVPELVHNRSGVGSHMVIDDMDGDGMNDIVVSVNIGTYVFLNRR